MPPSPSNPAQDPSEIEITPHNPRGTKQKAEKTLKQIKQVIEELDNPQTPTDMDSAITKIRKLANTPTRGKTEFIALFNAEPNRHCAGTNRYLTLVNKPDSIESQAVYHPKDQEEALKDLQKLREQYGDHIQLARVEKTRILDQKELPNPTKSDP